HSASKAFGVFAHNYHCLSSQWGIPQIDWRHPCPRPQHAFLCAHRSNSRDCCG
ncbi:hypothetical protein H0H87_003638, partial [Tephrocybe sp. NHM501043]